MRIERLTKEQESRFDEWANMWRAIGQSTQPADFDRTIAAAHQIYRMTRLNRPIVVLRMCSPISAAIGGAYAWMTLQKSKERCAGETIESHFWNQFLRWTVSDINAQIVADIDEKVDRYIWAQSATLVGPEPELRSWSSDTSREEVLVAEGIDDEFLPISLSGSLPSLWTQTLKSVDHQLRLQIAPSSLRQVKIDTESIWANVHRGVNNGAGGTSRAAWCACVSFYRDVMGWDSPGLSRFKLLEELARSCSWIWWHEDVLAISDRPAIVHHDPQGRLHCDNGPSIVYRDGWSSYHWHGMRISQSIVEKPEHIDMASIRFEDNIEVRRVMIERYGYGRYLKDAGLILVDSRPPDDPFLGLRDCKLWRDDETDITLLDMLNSTAEPDGSVKRYVLAVDSEAYEGRAGREVLAAMASTWRRSSDHSLIFERPEDYRPMAES